MVKNQKVLLFWSIKALLKMVNALHYFSKSNSQATLLFIYFLFVKYPDISSYPKISALALVKAGTELFFLSWWSEELGEQWPHPVSSGNRVFKGM